MSVDLEERLRTMYSAVAATTLPANTLPANDLIEPSTMVPARDRHVGRRTLALVAVAAMVVIGLVVVVSNRRPSSTAASLKARPYAVPGYVPPGYGFFEATPSPQVRTGLIGFPTTPSAVSFLVFQGAGSQQIIVSSTPDDGLTPSPGDRAVTLASGAHAQLSTELDSNRRTIAWVQPGGHAASIRADGVTEAQIIGMADSTWFVTAPMWRQVIARGGFTTVSLDSWHPPGEQGDRVTMTVTGSLQQSLTQTVTLHDGFTMSGFGFGSFAVADNPCARTQFMSGTSDSARVLLWSYRAVDAFRVTMADGSTRTVTAGMPPGIPSMRTATIFMPSGSQRVTAECVGGES